MVMLSREALIKWRSVQPKDVASVTEDPAAVDPEFAETVERKLQELKSAGDVMAFVAEKAEAFKEIGRAGRLRFLAWVLAHKYSDIDDLMVALMSDGSEEDSGDSGSSGEGLERVAPFFYSDLLAFAEALGPRIAAQIVDGETLDIVAGAANDVGTDYEMKGQM